MSARRAAVDTALAGNVLPLFPDGPPETAEVRVLLVDDHELLGQILTHALVGAGITAELVAEPSAESIGEALRRLRPSVVLLDLDLGERFGTGLRHIATFTDAGARVVMLTGTTDRLALAECLEAGAATVVGKDEPFERLLAAVDDVAAGGGMAADARHALLSELWACRAEAKTRLKPFRRLTRREGEVLEALADGLAAAEIADRDYVSRATVRTQIRGILVKLGVTSQLAAVALARQSGWLEG